LDTLSTDGSSPVGQGAKENASGYTFTSVADTTNGNYYTIIAIPPQTDMTTYTLVETGVVYPE
jgi:hypothetical protein